MRPHDGNRFVDTNGNYFDDPEAPLASKPGAWQYLCEAEGIAS